LSSAAPNIHRRLVLEEVDRRPAPERPVDLKKLLPPPRAPRYNPRRQKVTQKRGECLIRVKVRMNESLDQLLKRFKKACEKEGLTRDIKRTAFYEKPSEKRRRQERQLIRKMQKEANLR
jgi:small subunit ribosomal protein S21